MKSTNLKNGFTLVELLIAIAVLSVLAVIVVPSVRIISKQRQSREAARYLGSAVTAARSQAVTDGTAGILIERNNNLLGGNGANRIYRVRVPRPFAGYGQHSLAEVTLVPPTPPTAPITQGQAIIPARYRTSGGEFSLFHVNDFVQFNHRGPKYRVVAVRQTLPAPPDYPAPINENYTTITFEIGPSDPIPPAGDLPFKIYRRPVKVPTTLTELPRGYMIDLSNSGHGATGTQFDMAGGNDVVILFNESGELDTIYENGLGDVSTANTVFPEGTVYLLVTEFKVNGTTNLEDKRSLWVTINSNNGITAISSNVGAGNVFDARQIARTGKQAGQ